MSFPHVSFVLEVIGACLLLVMIIYAIQLNRRLSGLQSDKAYLQKLIMGFNEATESGRKQASAGCGWRPWKRMTRCRPTPRSPRTCAMICPF